MRLVRPVKVPINLIVQDKHLHFYFSKNLSLELVFVHVMEINISCARKATKRMKGVFQETFIFEKDFALKYPRLHSWDVLTCPLGS